ncbi:hypothetical protein CDAR_169261 [Caerostris darwini]|uniref:Uncharacterized protein n=1 Tax=Caerostris darwini TaxID=1538125 RepID=A0AAV4QL82_9ARAC|nr:hypothetical protein CDAR_169261 [Caerostris darwini]
MCSEFVFHAVLLAWPIKSRTIKTKSLPSVIIADAFSLSIIRLGIGREPHKSEEGKCDPFFCDANTDGHRELTYQLDAACSTVLSVPIQATSN